MSEQTVITQNENFLHVDFDVSKVFIRNNQYKQNETFANNTGGQKTFKAGTLLARNATTGNVVPLLSTNTTLGQNIPVGILAKELVDVADAATVVGVPMGVSGDVAQEKLLFEGADDLDTVISDRRLKDRIPADTQGIHLREGFEMTKADNG